MKYHPFINGLRAIAVVPVILFHYNAGLFPGGYAGVDVFFVISGYLITGLLMGMLGKNRFSLIAFYERRARRILPALFFTCALCLAFGWIYFMPQDFRQLGASLAGAAVFATNFVFAQDTGYFAAPALTKPLLHTWSLAVEEQFYIFYPPLLYVLFRWARGKKEKLAAALAALLALSLALNLFMVSRAPEATFYLLHTRAWELLAGALAFLCLQDIPLKARAAAAASAGGLLLLLFSFTCYDRGTAFPGIAAIAPVLGTVLLIWANLHARTLSGKMLASPPAVAVGLVSYALYLYHWPILVCARYYLDRSLTGPETLAALALTGLLAAATYFIFERPVREGRQLASRRAIFSFSLAGLVLLGLAGAADMQAAELPIRFPPAVLQYLADAPAPRMECGPAGAGFGTGAEKCRIGDASHPTDDFLLWGDSHANSLVPGLIAVAQAHHKAGYMIWEPGCPPVLHLDLPQHENLRCPAENDGVLRFIRERKIHTVILAARWDLVLPFEENGPEAGRNTNQPREKLVTAGGETLYDLAAFDAGFRDTIATLKKLGLRIWVVRQTPPQLHDVSSTLAKDAWLGRDVATLSRSVDDVNSRFAPIDAVFDKVRNDVGFVDPMANLCADGKTCIASLNGRSLYGDATHMSNYGAIWIKDMWQPVFAGMR